MENVEVQKIDKLEKFGHVLKSVPEELLKSVGGGDTENGLWGYASVEVPDSDGDIIRIDGIDYSQHHNPSVGRFLKVLASHVRSLPDGSPPVLGRIESFHKTVTSDGHKALAFYMTWFKNENGEYPDLVKKWKPYYDKGYL